MKHSNNSIELLDTTLRDGEQTQGVSFSPAEKANIAKALLQTLNVDRIEVASARVSEGEKVAVSNIMKWASDNGYLERIEVLGFVDHTKSVDWIVEAGGKVINLLTKGSENHCTNQLKKTLPEHIFDIKKTIDYAKEKGVKVNVYLEDWSNGYMDSPEYVYEMMSMLQACEIHHFMLPDTLGVLSPDEVYASMSDMTTRFPNSVFDFHPHNDYGLATANSLAAIKAGARCVHCTINCLGERAGNASLCEVAVAFRDKLKIDLGINEKHLVTVSRMVESFSGKRIGENAPIVGLDVFTQTSGIHADGDIKGNLYISDLMPERFARSTSYALGKLSGKASIVKNLEALDLHLSPENQKRVLNKVVELGDSKEVLTTEDLPMIIADVLESKDDDPVQLLNLTVTSGHELQSTASLRLKIEDKTYGSTAGGNGGYAAFMNALKEIMAKEDIDVPKLVDYEIRIPRGGKTDALTECIITWANSEAKHFKTRGVNSDQVIAAVNATIKMLNMHFFNKSAAELSL